MEQARDGTSSRRRSVHGALAVNRAAAAGALALLPTIRELMAAGFVSQRGLANELNRRGILGVAGGRWHRNTVARMLTSLGLLTSGKGGVNKGLAGQRVAGVPAEGPRPTNPTPRKTRLFSLH